jgi:hypothetical protein
MPRHTRPKDGVASLAYSRPKDGVASLAYGRGIHPFPAHPAGMFKLKGMPM